MSRIANVTYCRNIALVTLRNVPSESGIIAEILTTISAHGINVDMISQTAPQGQTISVAFTVALESIGQLMPIINGFTPKYTGLSMELATGMTKLNFYDSNMVNTPGVAAGVFTLMASGSIHVHMITTSTTDISILIPEHEEDAALALCRQAYGLEPEDLPFS